MPLSFSSPSPCVCVAFGVCVCVCVCACMRGVHERMVEYECVCLYSYNVEPSMYSGAQKSHCCS